MKFGMAKVPGRWGVRRRAESARTDATGIKARLRCAWTGEGKMLKLIIAWISIMTTGALAQSLSDAEKRAVNELSGEMLECSVYFLVSATCLQGRPDPSTPQITKNLNEQGAKFGELAITTGRIVGMTDAALGARAELIRADMMKAVNGNCTKIATLVEKYSNFCQLLTKNSDPRLEELMQGKKCTGLYKC